MIENSKKGMNKRGDMSISALILVGLVVFGGFIYSAEKIISEHRYVGDTNTNLYYDLKTCEIKSLEKTNIISFISKEEALNNCFKPASCVEQ